MKPILLALLLAFTGCATQQPIQIPKEILVPVPTPCIKAEDIPAIPDYESTHTEERDGVLILRMARDLAKAAPYQQALRTIAINCSTT